MTNKERDEVISFIGEDGKTYAELQRRYGDKASAIMRELTSTATTAYPYARREGNRYTLDEAGLDRMDEIKCRKRQDKVADETLKFAKLSFGVGIVSVLVTIIITWRTLS